MNNNRNIGIARELSQIHYMEELIIQQVNNNNNNNQILVNLYLLINNIDHNNDRKNNFTKNSNINRKNIIIQDLMNKFQKLLINLLKTSNETRKNEIISKINKLSKILFQYKIQVFINNENIDIINTLKNETNILEYLASLKRYNNKKEEKRKFEIYLKKNKGITSHGKIGNNRKQLIKNYSEDKEIKGNINKLYSNLRQLKKIKNEEEEKFEVGVQRAFGIRNRNYSELYSFLNMHFNYEFDTYIKEIRSNVNNVNKQKSIINYYPKGNVTNNEEEKNYEKIDVPGDGFCGYHAIVLYCYLNNIDLFGNINRSTIINGDSLVVDFIKKLEKNKDNSDLFDHPSFMDKLFNKNNNPLNTNKKAEHYIKKLNTGKNNKRSWLNNDFLILLSYLYNKTFIILTNQKNYKKIVIKHQKIKEEVDKIIIYYNGFNHYECLVEK